MGLIYAPEAFELFGPAPIAVHDANGRRLRHVIASDPATGEVIQLISLTACDVLAFLLLGQPRRLLWMAVRSHRLTIDGDLVRCHYFAPAPLTISQVELGAP